jgi:FAD:protein FMN transferase
LASNSASNDGAGPPKADRLLIPVGLKPSAVRRSRIDAPVRRLSGATMGTGWSLAFAAPESVANAAVVAALEDVFALVIRQMSGWERESDLSRFNRMEAGWQELPQDFYRVLSRAIEIAGITGGAYDPTLGARVDALGFGPSNAHSGESRDPGQTASLVQTSSGSPTSEQDAGPDLGPGFRRHGWRDIKLDPDGRRALQPGGVTVDLSSIAKGHAVDLCAQALKALGVPSFLMEIGGEFVGEGVKPDGKPWWVELQLSDVAPAPSEPAHTDAALVNLALATSGDFVRRRDGVSHLLDGRTGEPVGGVLSGVSVMHASAMEADGWATALFALGPEAGMLMANSQKLAAVFARRTQDGARFELSRAASEMLG